MSIDRIESALRFISADNRETWLRCGMAIKAELGEAGFEQWDTWSRDSNNYNAKDIKAVWRSIHANGEITIGTLFREAKLNGWRDGGAKPDPVEAEKRQREAARRTTEEAAKAEARHKAAAESALSLWNAAQPANQSHPYLIRKRVKPTESLREIDAGKAADLLGYSPKSSDAPLNGRLLVAPIKVGNALSTLEFIDGDGRKTALAGGRKKGSYWAAHPLPVDAKTLLIAEGVATALTVQEATGHPAIAALSCGNLGKVAAAMRQRHPDAQIIIAGDVGNGQAKAEDAARAINGALAVPPTLKDGSTAISDFNDMALAAGLDAVRDVIAKAAEDWGKSTKPAFVDIVDLLSNPAAPDWVIDGYVPADSITLAFGESGGGKSLLGVDLACSTVTGTPWAGREVKAGVVVIFIGEGHNGIARRVAAWVQAHCPIPKGRLFISPQPIPFDAQGLETALDFINGLPEKPVMIQVDTLARHMIGDENSAADVGEFVRNLDVLRQTTGANVCAIHHSGHGSKDRARGSTALRAAVDTEFRVEKAGDRSGVVTCTKMKDAEMPLPLVYEITRVDLPPAWADPKTGAITSSVIFNARPNAPIPRQHPGLTRAQKVALEALKKAISENNGENYALIGDWRRLALEAGVSTSEKKAARYSAFNRCVEALADGFVEINGYQCSVVPDESTKSTNSLHVDNMDSGMGGAEKSTKSTHPFRGVDNVDSAAQPQNSDVVEIK